MLRLVKHVADWLVLAGLIIPWFVTGGLAIILKPAGEVIFSWRWRVYAWAYPEKYHRR